MGLPSSSTLSEPRRCGSVPSSITVTPGAATRSPMRPENAETALAVEVAFQAVADRFVQQDAGPARPEHHRHDAGRRRLGRKIDDRLVHRLARVVLEALVGEIGVVEAPAAAAGTLLAPPVLLGDDLHAKAAPTGRTSAAVWPSERATYTTSYSEARCAITWLTRGSSLRAMASTRSSSATFCGSGRLASGSTG